MRLCPVCGEVYPSQTIRCRAHDAELVEWADVEDAPTGSYRDTPQVGELTDPEVPLYAAPTPQSSIIVDPSLVLSRTPRTPRVLGGRYRLGELIGIGGYGAVFAAHDERLDKRVAVKALSPAVTVDAEVVRRFKREAIAASSVRHECIVDITDYDVEAGVTSFIVMEYLDGSDLSETLAAEAPLAPGRALAIAVQCASGLTAAHAAGVIHRDLKPANIFLVHSASRADSVKIIDFGIAKIISADGAYSSITSASKVVGTPYYMAPEQARGLALDGRADVYALGVILFEMLTGERPFVGASALEILTHAATQARVAPSSRRPELAAIDGLDELVVRAISAERARRFGSMRAFGEEIVACLRRVDAARLSGLPTIAAAARAGRVRRTKAAAAPALDPARPSTLESSSGEVTGARQVRRRRWALAVGAAAIAATAIAVWSATATSEPARDRDEVAAVAPARPAPQPAPPPPPPVAIAPPPVAVAPPIARTVHLTSSPSGAAVSSDRRGELGVTPLDVTIGAGRERLSLSYRGHVARTIAIDPSSEPHLHVTLAAQRARPARSTPPSPPPSPGVGIKDW